MVLAWIGQDLWGHRTSKRTSVAATAHQHRHRPTTNPASSEQTNGHRQRRRNNNNNNQHQRHKANRDSRQHSDAFNNNSDSSRADRAGIMQAAGQHRVGRSSETRSKRGGAHQQRGASEERRRKRRGLAGLRDPLDEPRTLIRDDETNCRKEKALYALLILVTFLCYWNSLHGDFVHDDVVAVCGNRDVLGKTALTELFFNDFWGKPMADPRSHKSYRPLTVFTFRLNQALRGGQVSWDFHLVNLLLHLIATLLLTFLCRRILQMDRECSFTAAFLFAAHPIHTEAVSGIVGRAEVLGGCFYFLSLIAFCRSLLQKEDRRISANLVMTVVSSALALLAKEQGVTVLGVCVVYFVLVPFRKNSSRYSVPRSWLDKRLLTVVASLACLLAFRVWMLSGSLPQFSDQDNPAACSPYILTRFLTYSYLVFFNLRLLLSPVSLSYDWQMGSIPLVETLTDPRNVPTLLTFLAFVALIWRTSQVSKLQNRRALVISLATLVLPFLPASNLFFTVGFVVAERVIYIPSAGFCMLVSYGLDRLRDQGWRIAWIGRLCVCVLLFFFIIRTIRRNQDWASREALFLSGVKTVPQNAKVHYNYANLQKDLGNFQLADHHYRIAIALWPDHASAHNNLGTVLNSPEQAEKHFKLALSINPQHARAYFNLASLYSKQGQLELPVALLQHSVDLEPDFGEAFASLALLHAEMGDNKQAEKYYKKAINLDNESADYLNNFGIFLQKTGRIEEAVSQYQRAIKVQPNHTAALVNAARTFKSMKNSLEAENLYQRALSIQEDPQIMDNLGVLYLSSGRLADAKRLYNTLMEKFPDHQDAKCRFAQVLIQERCFDLAESILVNLTNTNSSHREALHQLAVLHTAKNQTTEALEYILRALTLCPLTEKTCAQLHVKHGDILRDLNALDEAAESYLMAISLESSITHAHLNLAVIRHLQGNYAEALVHYQEATILDPENKLVKENKDKLQRTIFRTSRSCNSIQANACRRW